MVILVEMVVVLAAALVAVAEMMAPQSEGGGDGNCILEQISLESRIDSKVQIQSFFLYLTTLP